jgi:hypothetical protein
MRVKALDDGLWELRHEIGDTDLAELTEISGKIVAMKFRWESRENEEFDSSPLSPGEIGYVLQSTDENPSRELGWYEFLLDTKDRLPILIQ